MATIRQKLIRPVTIVKVQRYLKDIGELVFKNQNFSLDKLARERNISGSNGTAIIKLGILKTTDIKGYYKYGDDFNTEEKTAKLIIEEVRRMNDSKTTTKINSQEGTQQNNPSDDPLADQLNKALKTNQVKTMLERALKQAMPKPENTLFENHEYNPHDDLIQIASAIATGVYSHIPFVEDMSDEQSNKNIDKFNTKIVLIAKDLLSKLKA